MVAAALRSAVSAATTLAPIVLELGVSATFVRRQRREKRLGPRQLGSYGHVGDGCLIAWLTPMGRSNWNLDVACAALMSRAASAIPVSDAAASTTPRYTGSTSALTLTTGRTHDAVARDSRVVGSMHSTD